MPESPAPRTPARELVLAAIANAKASDRLMTAAVERTFQKELIRGKGKAEVGRLSRALLEQAEPRHISHNVMRRIERNRLSVRRSISYSDKIHEMSEARKLGTLQPSWKLDIKNAAYNFVDAIGGRRPHSDKVQYSIPDIPPTYPTVVKATRATGAKGVYLAFNEDRIVHVRDHKVFSSWDEMEQHAERLMAPTRSAAGPLPDHWMTEELILEDSENAVAARNLKFYCFYGEVAFIQESRREPDLQVTFYTPDNEPTVTGRYEDLDYEGVGVRPEDVEAVADISRQIPHPFMRIDMLNGEDGLVLGEFTPRPGNFDELNEEWDRALGEAWVRAEDRLYRDLLEGKSFRPFLDATQLLD